jgi:hypothetical protein
MVLRSFSRMLVVLVIATLCSAGLLCDALRHLDDALSKLGTDGDHATASADAAIAAQRKLETAYYAGMVGLLGDADRTERITRRELYRRNEDGPPSPPVLDNLGGAQSHDQPIRGRKT